MKYLPWIVQRGVTGHRHNIELMKTGSCLEMIKFGEAAFGQTTYVGVDIGEGKVENVQLANWNLGWRHDTAAIEMCSP